MLTESRCGTQGQAMVEMRYEVVSTPTTALQLSSAVSGTDYYQGST